MRTDVGLKCLIRSESLRADGAVERLIRGCGIVIRHRLRPETMDDGGVELVGV